MIPIIDDLDGLCSMCIHRFRRVFITEHLEDYVDEDGNNFSDIMPSNSPILLEICLWTETPMGDDETIECSHFEPKENTDFKHEIG